MGMGNPRAVHPGRIRVGGSHYHRCPGVPVVYVPVDWRARLGAHASIEATGTMIVNDISDQFSQAEVPLAYEVIPMFEGLERELQNLQNDCEVPDMIHIAAQAALIMVGKYYALTDDCEVYRISISESESQLLA
jgi:hypothetical protein